MLGKNINVATTVCEIMAKNPATLGRNDTLDVADHVMTLGRIRHMPVVDRGRVVGMVSQRDLFRAPLTRVLGYAPKAQRRIMKTMKIKEIMKKPVITISPDSSISVAARQMVDKKIGCLPVVEGDNLVGIITETDILRYVAEHCPCIESTRTLRATSVNDSNFAINSSEP